MNNVGQVGNLFISQRRVLFRKEKASAVNGQQPDRQDEENLQYHYTEVEFHIGHDEEDFFEEKSGQDGSRNQAEDEDVAFAPAWNQDQEGDEKSQDYKNIAQPRVGVDYPFGDVVGLLRNIAIPDEQKLGKEEPAPEDTETEH